MATIRPHEFNSEWLGVPFGVSCDPALLTCGPEELKDMVEGFEVVEVRCPYGSVPDLGLVPQNGIVHVDIQLGYQLRLARIGKKPPGVGAISFSKPATSTQHFDFLGFDAERYSRLSMVDSTLLDERYQIWANTLVNEYPDWCLSLETDGVTIGYAFGRPITETHLNLDLVVASRRNTIPGLGIYLAALHEYRNRGITKVTASFSAHHLAVVNVHVALGCRITSSTDVWFYERFSDPHHRSALLYEGRDEGSGIPRIKISE